MFREQIKQQYDSLTPSFKRLAQFILDNELETAFMTATELASTLGVDAATVVRFAQTLGYEGYRALCKEVQQTVREELTAVHVSFERARTNAERLQAILENERHNLYMATAQVTAEAAEVVKQLAKARRVWVVGEAGGRYLAAFFADHLRMAGVKAVAVDASPAEAASILWNLDGRDLVIGLGAPGTGHDTAAVLHLARERGAATVAIASTVTSPPARAAEQALICPSSTPIGISSAASLTTMLMALWQALLARNSKLTEHITTLQDTYTNLLSARSKQAEEKEKQTLW